MRKAIGSIALVVLLSVPLWCPAEAMRQPTYRSGKPLYAKLALDEGADKVLTLAFDESAGTGRGYNTMYADSNLNGDLSDDKAIKGSTQRRGGSSYTCSFSPVAVDVPYNEKSKGLKKLWEFSVAIHEDPPEKPEGLGQGQNQRQISVDGRVRLKDKAAQWEYAFSFGTDPAESLAGTAPIRFGEKPTLKVVTQPDRQKEGNTGIAAYLSLDNIYISDFLKGGQPPNAHVFVKTVQGKPVHSEDVSHSKLRFG